MIGFLINNNVYSVFFFNEYLNLRWLLKRRNEGKSVQTHRAPTGIWNQESLNTRGHDASRYTTEEPKRHKGALETMILSIFTHYIDWKYFIVWITTLFSLFIINLLLPFKSIAYRFHHFFIAFLYYFGFIRLLIISCYWNRQL